MKIHFLGTGTSQGIPVIGSNHPVCLSDDPHDNRLRSSILIEWDHQHILVDCGPDFRQQMLRINNHKLDAILFTHEHSDHTAGIDDIRPYCFYNEAPMPIFAQERVMNNLKKRFDYVFETQNRYPGAPSVAPHVITPYEEFLVGNKKVMPLLVQHGNLPILGYRFDKFAYLTDVKTLSEQTYSMLKDLDVLVLSALHLNTHQTHSNLQEALAHVNIIKPKQTYFTHMGYQMGFHAEVDKSLPKNINLAYDKLIIEI